MQALFELDNLHLPSLRIYKQEAFVRDETEFIPIMHHRLPVTQDYEVPV